MKIRILLIAAAFAALLVTSTAGSSPVAASSSSVENRQVCLEVPYASALASATTTDIVTGHRICPGCWKTGEKGSEQGGCVWCGEEFREVYNRTHDQNRNTIGEINEKGELVLYSK